MNSLALATAARGIHCSVDQAERVASTASRTADPTYLPIRVHDGGNA
jgi:hypothetical protein